MNIHKTRTWLFFLLLLAGCSTISVYDFHSYETATSIKAETLSLLNHGVEQYPKYEVEINSLSIKIDKAYEYEKGKPKNSESTKLWQKIKDPEGHLVGGYIKLWKEKGELSQDFIEQFKKNIEYAFNQIIELESAKIKE